MCQQPNTKIGYSELRTLLCEKKSIKKDKIQRQRQWYKHTNCYFPFLCVQRFLEHKTCGFHFLAFTNWVYFFILMFSSMFSSDCYYFCCCCFCCHYFTGVSAHTFSWCDTFSRFYFNSDFEVKWTYVLSLSLASANTHTGTNILVNFILCVNIVCN